MHGSSNENLRNLNAILTGLDEVKQLFCGIVSLPVVPKVYINNHDRLKEG